jgi:CHAT domain-containing protein
VQGFNLPVPTDSVWKRQSGRARPRLHWVPTGPFTFLPVHAAGIYSGHADKHDCCSNYVVSSYAPTLSALLRARQQLSEATPRTSLTMIAAAAHQSPGMTQLDSVKDEIRTVCSHARDAGIHVVELGAISAAATIADVSAALPDASIVHFACHGVQDALDPLESRLCLGDGGLSVRELMRLRVPHARLAVLSACETAKGDGAQPDQGMHLAATLLFCGFPAVIGTMWYVHPAMREEPLDFIAFQVYGRPGRSHGRPGAVQNAFCT